MFDRTRELLRRLTGEIVGESETGADDRRISVRFPVDITAVCQVNGAVGVSRNVRVRDVSRNGFSMVFDRDLLPGTLINLDLPSRAGQPATTVLAYAKHSSPRSDGTWLIGCVFASELDEGTLQKFGVSPVKAPSADKRHWERTTPRHCTAVLRPITSEVIPAFTGDVLNLSPTGAGLTVRTRLEPGTVVNLDLHGSVEHSGMTILATVVYLSKGEGSDWVIGCTFIRDLGDDELQCLL